MEGAGGCLGVGWEEMFEAPTDDTGRGGTGKRGLGVYPVTPPLGARVTLPPTQEVGAQRGPGGQDPLTDPHGPPDQPDTRALRGSTGGPH